MTEIKNEVKHKLKMLIVEHCNYKVDIPETQEFVYSKIDNLVEQLTQETKADLKKRIEKIIDELTELKVQNIHTDGIITIREKLQDLLKEVSQ